MMKTLKTIVAAGLLAALTPTALKAQTHSGAFAETYVLTNYMGYGVDGGYQYAFTPHASIAAGAGVESLAYIPSINITAFVRGKIHFTAKRASSPYASVDMGYSLHPYDASGYVFFTPTVGYQFSHLYLGAGCVVSLPSDSDPTELIPTLRIGYTFGHGRKDTQRKPRQPKAETAPRKAPASLATNYLKLELGGGLGLTKAGGVRDRFGGQPELTGTTMFARIVGQHRFSEQLSAGVGTGLELMGYKPQGEGYQLGKLHLPLFVRGQADFNPSSTGVHPYVALDLGYRLPLSSCDEGDFEAKGVVLEPQVGLSRGHWSAALGYSLTHYRFRGTTDYPSDCTCTASAVTLRLGYAF